MYVHCTCISLSTSTIEVTVLYAHIICTCIQFSSLSPSFPSQVCPYDPDNHSWHLDELARAMQEEEKKPNPVVQRIKIIMALGLSVVHLHSHFLSSVTGLSFGFPSTSSDVANVHSNMESEGGDEGEGNLEKVPLPDYLLWKAFNLTADQVSTSCT